MQQQQKAAAAGCSSGSMLRQHVTAATCNSSCANTSFNGNLLHSLQPAPTKFVDSWHGWSPNYTQYVHQPEVDWLDIPQDNSGSENSEGEQDELKDAATHGPLDASARAALGDAEDPEMVR